MDFSNIKDLKKLESNITLITETLNEGEQLSNSFKTTYNKLDSDIKSVTKLSTEIQQAIQADTKLASNITSSIKSFTPQSGMRLVTNSVEDFLNNVLGNVYPLITELITTIQEVKDILPEKEPKEEKPKIQRLKGTNFYWNRPEMPKVYIGKAHASGSGFDVLGNNLSTNPKLINSPMTLDGTYNIANRQDSFNATLDVHNLSSSSLFSASYHAPNVPTNLDFLTSNSDLDVMIAIENDKSVSISGNAILSNTDVTIPTFEPAFAYSICNEAVQQIDNTYFNVLTGFNNAGNMNLNINTDFDNQFMNVVTKLVNKELTTIKNEATVAINQKLEEYSAPIKEKINEFNVYKEKLNSYKKDLENKIAELKAKVEEGKQKAIEYSKQQAESKIEETVNKYVDTDKIDSLKKWF